MSKRKFIEVFVNAPVEICEQRDPKGTDQLTVAESVAKITEYLHLQDEDNAVSI